MALDSDIMNPDSHLAVRFYQREVDNEFQTALQGRPIKKMADFIRIEIPGDRNTIIDTFVNESHKKRFPMQWAQYQNEKADGGNDVQGTLLKDWPLLSAAIAAELKHFNFYTVEQIAGASDMQLNNLGMAAGMSPSSLKEKAKAFLANAKDSALVQQQADELRKRDQEIEAMKQQMQELLGQMNKQKTTKGKSKEEAPEVAEE
jgi:hypothetical protein